MQALAEAASGPLPPSALLPILRAKETGPGATDLTLEVLERITTREEDSGGASNDASKTAVIGEKTRCRLPKQSAASFRFGIYLPMNWLLLCYIFDNYLRDALSKQQRERECGRSRARLRLSYERLDGLAHSRRSEQLAAGKHCFW